MDIWIYMDIYGYNMDIINSQIIGMICDWEQLDKINNE